jgi:opacity protein-like surface antigen
MTRIRTPLLVGLFSVMAATAHADVTGFIGANTTPANRLVKGAAVGFSLLIIGFEFEYSDTTEEAAARAPGLKTGMANVLLQPPVPIFGLQPYFTTGGGVYQETAGTHQDTNFGLNAGGGVKISLAGPLRLRVDYRVFTLGSGAQNSPTHRIYAGLNFAL